MNSVQFIFGIDRNIPMKKVFLTAFFLLTTATGTAKAEEILEGGQFYEDVLISDDLKMRESSDSAKEKASHLLDQKPKIIKIDGAPLEFRAYRPQQPATVVSKPVDTSTKYGEAPFGLSWGATYNQTKALGVNLTKIEHKDSVNNFIVTKLPKPISDFHQIIVSFGENNSLWRLSAYGTLNSDDPATSKALQLYKKYYDLLQRKYGNAQEFFTPKIVTVEKTVKDEYGRDKIEIEKVAQPIGNPDFLTQLQNGEAVLYATFEDKDVGAILAVNVDSDGKSYIIIDYTNLQIFREREKEVLDAL